MSAPREGAGGESLWWITLSPAVWLAHFLVSYVTVAVWCAKAVGREGSLEGVRGLVLAYGAVALLAVVITGARAFRRHRFGEAHVPHDFDTPESRHRFLGFAIFLLSALSAVGIVYDALPILALGTCR